MFACNICDKPYQHKHNVINHKKRVHDREKKYNCDQCEYSAFQRSQIKIHTLKIHTVQEGTFHCDYCEKDFPSTNNLKRHKFNVHEKWKHHKCEKCEASFRSPGRLSEHINAKHVPSDLKMAKDITCDICNKQFDRIDYLRTHKYFIHKNIKVKCHTCGKGCKSPGVLKKHLQVHHCDGNPKIVKCDICEKEFSDIGDFKKHMNYVHNRMRKYPCEHCEKKFATSYNLKTHLRLIHKKGTLNTIKCNLCEKEFALRTNLITHMNNVHLKIKRYHCIKCEKTFFDSTKLKKHTNKNPSCAETKT